MIDKFKPEVIEKLQCYVYRLVDPRNGQTFYVGKGKGNRVFAHAKDALKDYNGETYIDKTKDSQEDDVTNKIATIREIKKEGMEPICIIHRWGMDDATAYEVESALIDAYAGLSNLVSGHNGEKGVTNCDIIDKTLTIEEYKEPKFPYIIIKINNIVLEERGNDIYETCRSAWKVKKETVEKYKYAIASLNGIVKGVYEINKWQNDSRNCLGRYEFIGKEAPKEISELFVGKRLPSKYIKKGMASPILYSKN